MSLELVIFVGFQASGKSTYYRRFAATHKQVSKDLLGNSNRDKKQTKLLEEYLGAGQSVVVDNTNLSVKNRAELIATAKKFGARVICYWFSTPFEECLARNEKREGKAKIPAVALHVAKKRFQKPTLEEGFDELHEKDIILLEEGSGSAPELAPSLLKSDEIRGAIFLDKDGVVVDDSGYPYVIPKNTLISGVSGALAKLAKLGKPIIVVSNQSWVAKGCMTLENTREVFETLKKKVSALGGRIDGTYFCPHATKENCACRKPGTGMFLRAAKEHNIDLSQSVMVGDQETDIQAGIAAGVVKTVLLLDDKNSWSEKATQPNHICFDLVEATPIIEEMFGGKP